MDESSLEDVDLGAEVFELRLEDDDDVSEHTFVTSAGDAEESPSELLQTFLQYALTELGEDWLLLSFLPLPADSVLLDLQGAGSARILAPRAEGDLLDLAEVERLVEDRQCILGVCTFIGDEEKAAARAILSQLRGFDLSLICVALLLPALELPDNAEAGIELAEIVMGRHDELLAMGAHDIVLNPSLAPGVLQTTVQVMRLTRNQHISRMEAQLLAEAPLLPAHQIRALEERERELLWVDNVRALMPQFPSIDTEIHEDSYGVGGYTFLYKIESLSGNVMFAKNEECNPVVVKVISKFEVHDPFEVENINREYMFLSNCLTHPNIVQVIQMLHTVNNVYIAMEDAGENLQQYCRALPGCRLDEERALDVFKQIVDALGYMHQKDIVHRDVSLHHVGVRPEDEEHLHCTLLDFRLATLARDEQKSQTVCGELPFVAPEVVLSDFYVPRFIDCWSVGILLLEIAGGLTSLLMSADVDRNEEDSVVGIRSVVRFFSTPNCHHSALGRIGGVNSPPVLHHLMELLQLPPRARMPLPALSRRLNQNYPRAQVN